MLGLYTLYSFKELGKLRRLLCMITMMLSEYACAVLLSELISNSITLLLISQTLI